LKHVRREKERKKNLEVTNHYLNWQRDTSSAFSIIINTHTRERERLSGLCQHQTTDAFCYKENVSLCEVVVGLFWREHFFTQSRFQHQSPNKHVDIHDIYACRANDFLRQVVSLCVFHVRQFYSAHTRIETRNSHSAKQLEKLSKLRQYPDFSFYIPIHGNSSTNSPSVPHKRRLIWLKGKRRTSTHKSHFFTSSGTQFLNKQQLLSIHIDHTHTHTHTHIKTYFLPFKSFLLHSQHYMN
jgi:hypothetical protein